MANRSRARTRGRQIVDEEIAISLPPATKSTAARQRQRTRAASAVMADATVSKMVIDVPPTRDKSPVDEEIEITAPENSEPALQGKRSHFEHKSATIRLGAFTGAQPLETHLARLKNCAQYYGWDESDRTCHLKRV